MNVCLMKPVKLFIKGDLNMKTKTGKVIITIAAVLVIGIAIAVFCVMSYNAKYISKAEALDIAMQDASVSGAVILDKDVDFEHGIVTPFYEVELETADGEYEYKINAATGEILSSEHT